MDPRHSSTFPLPVAPSEPPTPLARGFAELDERLSGGAGMMLVCQPSPQGASALAAHLGRRARANGYAVVWVQSSPSAPMWREVALRLALARVELDPLKCAEQIAAAATGRRSVIILPLAPQGSWDRSVTAELALLPNAPLTIVIADEHEAARDIQAERFDVSASFNDGERRLWWDAVAAEGAAKVESGDVAALETWWETAREVPLAPPRSGAHVPESGLALFTALALVGRAWPEAEVGALGADEPAVRELLRAHAVRVDGGWISITPRWEARGVEAARTASRSAHELVAAALSCRVRTFGGVPDSTLGDPWVHARLAGLLLNACDYVGADREHGLSCASATDALARREIVSQWMSEVDAVPVSDQLGLRIRASTRSLAAGEADEAYRWAQTAAVLAPDDASVSLLLGRAAIGLGDLVAATVALERARARQRSGDDAVILAELAEIAYLSGKFVDADALARQVLASDPAMTTRLRARNTLGKILLAEASWAEADRHFTDDAHYASLHGDKTGELRARLNRGIALLSDGLMDEARSIFESVLSDGEALGDTRACAYALDNLWVVAARRHEYSEALLFAERTLKLRQRLGDRLSTARILANLAFLRCTLGLFDHAEHAIAFGRRMLGAGMLPARSANFSIAAATVALARSNYAEARREIARALVDSNSAHVHEDICAAHLLATRLALEDGDLGRARGSVESAGRFATTNEGRAEVTLLQAMIARAAGEDARPLAALALSLARIADVEDLTRQAHVLLSHIHRSASNFEAARQHVEQAILIRDQVAEALPADVRLAFLARPDIVLLRGLQSQLAADAEPELPGEPATSERHPGAGSTPPRAASKTRMLVGDDPVMRGLVLAIKKVARANTTVLVKGESGTGKELVAEALHRASDRADGPMVTVNCAALVETLLLSELFGHEKGAFTGAHARRRGRFEMAEGGTLFLDEIGDISAKTQVALLRVLQERTFERVGGTAAIRVNVRIICATHRDLRAMVERGEFREDLYYRLRGITLEVPPLRMRMADLPQMADHLLIRIAEERGEPKKDLAPDALELLANHRWPGNVRELENVLRAASVFADAALITAADLSANVDDLREAASSLRNPSVAPPSLRPPSVRPPPPAGSDVDAVDPIEDDDESGDLAPLVGESAVASAAYAQVRQGTVSLSDMKRQLERDCISRALAETKGNITRAAAVLGMKRPRLSQLVKQYGLAAVSSEDL